MMRFEFGNGSVLVNGSWLDGKLTLTQIKPPLGYVGTIKHDDLDNVEKVYSVVFGRAEHKEKLIELKRELNELTEGRVINFENVKLDFTNFNKESVRIVIEGINDCLRYCSQMALAC